MTKEQIEKLMQGATKEPLEDFINRCGHLKYDDEQKKVVMSWMIPKGEVELFTRAPELAQTCLDLFARLEELEKELKDSRDIAQVWCDRCYALGYDPMKTP